MGTPYTDPIPDGGAAPLSPAPAYTLFDSAAVTLATLLGSPVAGTILMGVNYRRLGKTALAVAAVAIGVAATILASLFGNKVPYTFSTIIAIGLLLMTRSCAQVLQGPAVAEHVSRGGKLGSRWAASGVGLAVLAVLASVIVVGVLGRQGMEENQKVTFGAHDVVYYSGSATEAEANSVGQKLKDIGYFTDRGANVFLSKDKGETVVSFVVKDGIWDNDNMVTSFEDVGGQVAPVLGASPLKVRMISSQREIKKQMTVGKVLMGHDEIFYIGSATEAEAKALGQSLTTQGFLKDTGASVMLSKGDGTVLSFVAREGSWDNPASVAAFETIARQAAPSIGGLPLKLRLLNTSVETKKEMTIQ